MIFNKVCPDCNNRLVHADIWYDIKQIVIFKRQCIYCRRIFVLFGYFHNYNEVKQYFINEFRMETYNKKENYENKFDEMLKKK